MTWHGGPLIGFDTETTGVDVFGDRIVTAAIVKRVEGADEVATWLINPGVEIPPQASAIHGISTEHAQRFGVQPAQALEEIANLLHRGLAEGIPLVGFNVSFDLTLLETELHRHQLPTLSERLGCAPTPVIDPLVLDRALDRYRRGKRTLGILCSHYGVDTGDLHDAGEDVRATLAVLDALSTHFEEITAMSAHELHTWQITKHRQWAEGYNEWRKQKNLAGPGANPHWPLHPSP
ncbi:MAG TPA: exonuclease domain-containing protein [Beutenbergiaceae bacterium]|nr:exonuclease domain-containing protein [Beutenbergiaceae bacterium]